MSIGSTTGLRGAGLLVCLAGAWLAWPVAAHAGNLYKCKGSDGNVVYTGDAHGYQHCKRLASYADAPRPAPKPGQSTYHDSKHGAVLVKPSVTTHQSAVGKVRVSRGTVYKAWWDKQHKVPLYTNVKPRGKYKVLFHYVATCYACAVDSTIDWHTVALNLTAYAKQIGDAAKDFGLDPSLLRALIHAESGFDPEAKSSKGAEGLTQLMPATASSLGVTDAWDPTQNIRGGARYLAKLLHDFDGDAKLAAAAYNAGEAAVRKYHGVPPYAQTQVYVQRVGILHQRYRAARAEALRDKVVVPATTASVAAAASVATTR